MIKATDLELDRRTAAAILDTDHRNISAVEFLRPHNHTWRVTAADGTIYFVKAHTKDWYDSNPASPVQVLHEVTGHRVLRAAGLAAAQVVTYSTDTDNPLGWPYLITRQLPGDPLIELLAGLPATEAELALLEVGRYLSTMHRITFEHPGYLIEGPPPPPDPNQWLHPLSRPERFLLYFFETLTADSAVVTVATRDTAAGLLERTLPKLRPAYQPLRFVHGDCHANAFYLHQADGRWEVSGILDMENCSAGSPLFDFVKLFIELAGRLGSTHRWWEPLFRGYQAEPDFELTRTLLIGHAHINYLGDSLWPAQRQDIVDHILDAHTWEQLFDLR